VRPYGDHRVQINKVDGPSTLLTNAEVFRVREEHVNVEEGTVETIQTNLFVRTETRILAAREHGPQGKHPRVSADESTSIKGVRN